LCGSRELLISCFVVPEAGGLPKKADKRPDWAICGKVTANMETLLFKEKFFDWPEASRLIQVRILLHTDTDATYIVCNKCLAL